MSLKFNNNTPKGNKPLGVALCMQKTVVIL